MEDDGRGDEPPSNYRSLRTQPFVTTPEATARHHALNLLLGEFHIAVEELLIPVLDRLSNDSLNLIGMMRERLQAAIFPSPTRVVLCTNGVASYTRGDYIAAIHILIPQIEGLLRDLTTADQKQRFTYRRTDTRDEMDRIVLGKLIEDLQNYRPESASLFDLISVLLNDLLGENLRNVVAHAFGDLKLYDKHHAAIVMLLLFQISSIEL